MGDGYDISDELAAMYGLRSALDGGVIFCGVSEEQFAISGVTYAWPKNSHLTWSLGFSRLGTLTDLDLKGAYEEAFKEISNACAITHEYVANPRSANILVNVARLDGPSGVLADMQIPVGNVSVNSTTLLGRIDDAEAWGLFESPPAGKIDFYRVALHELLHAHGLGHKPANINAEALIAPMYNPRIRHLQPADKAELVRRYGLPTLPPVVPAPAPATPAPGAKPKAKISITMPDGVTYEANGEMHKV
jgi:hypothetical protein